MELLEVLILVDEQDNFIGFDTKENCHLGNGKLHRGFVVFLFDEDMLLLQRRSPKKKLYGGYWDVSVASHPLRRDDGSIESYEEAASRRIKEELGIESKVELKRVCHWVYHAPFGKYSEREFCVLLTGEYRGKLKPDPNEIMDLKYMPLEDLRTEIAKPYYTPWFKTAFKKFMEISKLSK